MGQSQLSTRGIPTLFHCGLTTVPSHNDRRGCYTHIFVYNRNKEPCVRAADVQGYAIALSKLEDVSRLRSKERVHQAISCRGMCYIHMDSAAGECGSARWLSQALFQSTPWPLGKTPRWHSMRGAWLYMQPDKLRCQNGLSTCMETEKGWSQPGLALHGKCCGGGQQHRCQLTQTWLPLPHSNTVWACSLPAVHRKGHATIQFQPQPGIGL